MLADELSVLQFIKHSAIGRRGAKLRVVFAGLEETARGGSCIVLLGADGQSLGCGGDRNQLAELSPLHECLNS
jgi:hypothetical protein